MKDVIKLLLVLSIFISIFYKMTIEMLKDMTPLSVALNWVYAVFGTFIILLVAYFLLHK